MLSKADRMLSKEDRIKLTLLGFVNAATHHYGEQLNKGDFTVHVYPIHRNYSFVDYGTDDVAARFIIEREPWVQGESVLRIIKELEIHGSK